MVQQEDIKYKWWRVQQTVKETRWREANATKQDNTDTAAMLDVKYLDLITG